MSQNLAHVTLLVHNYDEALAFFTKALGFRLIEDTPLPDRAGWLSGLQTPTAPVSCSLKPLHPSKRNPSAIKLADVFSCFSTPMISGATTVRCRPTMSNFSRPLVTNPMASSPSSKISTATSGTFCNRIPDLTFLG